MAAEILCSEGQGSAPKLPWSTVSGMGGGSADQLCMFGWSYREDISEDMNFMVGYGAQVWLEATS